MKYDFNNWRQKYFKSTLKDQVEAHNEIGALYPDQAHYMLAPIQQLLLDPNITNVVEAGPWMGHLAQNILSDPAYDHIQSWYGYEIAEYAIERCVVEDSRFKYIIPERFDWWEEGIQCGSIFIATHFIEHLSNDHMKGLALALHVFSKIYFECPISLEGQSWTGYEGTHMLTFGWNDVLNLFSDYKDNELYNSESTRCLFKD
jgi:hypothetical protein